MTYEITVGGREFRVELWPGEPAGTWRCRLQTAGKAPRELELQAALPAPNLLSVLLDGRSLEIRRDREVLPPQIVLASRSFAVELRDWRSLRGRKSRLAVQDGPSSLAAPMPGKVLRVIAPPGTPVQVGQSILVIEAMKMQNELKSPKAGVVSEILVREGDAVNPGDVLAIVD